MRKIHGYVLARPTDKAIPNLVVTAFDSELTIVMLARHLASRLRDEEMWVRLGERIGSVLTDDAGHFEFELDHGAERETKNVVIAIFAPEDVQSVDNPVPLPPEQRLLYVSSLPRHAGSTEAYVVRLLPEQVDKFGIAVDGKVPTTSGADAASAAYGDAIERAFAFQEKSAALLQARIKAKVDAGTQRRATAKTKFQNLSALRPAERTHPQLLTDPAKLADLQKTTVTSGLTRLSASGASVTLTLTDAELTALGLSVDASGNITGDVSPLAIADHITSKAGGLDLVYKRPGDSADAILQKAGGK